MALPDGFLDELRSRVSLAQVVGRAVAWDMRKSNRGKGDWWAPCPFHQEKTASFHVDDRQGYYYCFGCHAKGDAITFLRQSANLDFLQAVEELAREAGMEMPARDPRAAAAAQARSTLAEVMEAAVRHYRAQLSSAAAGAARAYLARRGLDAAALERFEIGFAPPGWEGVREALTAQGIEVQQLLDAGLVRASDKGRAPYDTFRDRILFPIRDGRGRAVAFGGRAMDPGDGAKYLNSPDTALFDKGRTLYNEGPARVACGRGAALVVAEGYMDVIALVGAGFEGAVAPLGTAVTEHQLRMLWRLHPEPVVALDGDAAGRRAALRLLDLALPLMAAGHSLRFALMPEGQDPDEVLAAGGAPALQALLDAAVAPVDLIWERATEGRALDSPERRAALDRDLRAAVARIADPAIRAHTAADLRVRRDRLFGYDRAPSPARSGPAGGPERGGVRGFDRRSGGGWPRRAPPPAAALAATRAAARSLGAVPAEHLREAVILGTLLRTPAVLEAVADRLEETVFTGPGHAEIAAVLASCDIPATRAALEAEIARRLGPDAIEKLMAHRHLRVSLGLRAPDDVEAARACVEGELGWLAAQRGAALEIAEAAAALGASAPRGLAEEAAAYALDAGREAGLEAELEPDLEPDLEEELDADVPAEAGRWWETGAAGGEAGDDAEGAARAAARLDPLTWRLREAARARAGAGRSDAADRAEFDIAENGARIDRAERRAFAALIEGFAGRRAGRTDPPPAAGPAGLTPRRPPGRQD